MPPAMLSLAAKPLSGRYLSSAEREELAILRAHGTGVRKIARRIGRPASTISRELRREAANRSGGLDFTDQPIVWDQPLNEIKKLGIQSEFGDGDA